MRTGFKVPGKYKELLADTWYRGDRNESFCGVDTENKLKCFAASWDDPTIKNQLSVSANATRKIGVNGWSSYCEVVSGKVICMNLAGRGQHYWEMPDIADVTALAAGRGTLCALNKAHKVACWQMADPEERGLSHFTPKKLGDPVFKPYEGINLDF
jgi:hypothetical protein